jgi:hypothetical protein
MPRLRSVLVVCLLLLGGGTTLSAAPDQVERGVSSDSVPAAEKGERTPVPQYALAGLCALSLLVIVCMPSRKSHN